MALNRDFLGRGFAFPLKPNSAGAVGMSAHERDIEESIRIILGTAFGERVMRPDFGCGVHDLVFSPNNPATRHLVVHHVKEALYKWEPRIIQIEVKVQTDPQNPAIILVDLSYQVRATNSKFNLVYPFYLEKSEA